MGLIFGGLIVVDGLWRDKEIADSKGRRKKIAWFLWMFRGLFEVDELCRNKEITYFFMGCDRLVDYGSEEMIKGWFLELEFVFLIFLFRKGKKTD